jgi:hypothetical protein
MNTVSFRAASEAAESWLNTVALVAHFGERGNVDGAYRLLIGYSRALQTDYAEHIDVLHGAREALAAQSDAPVKWRGLQSVAAEPEYVYPHVWSSAHEAAVGIARLALDLLVVPLADITDAAEQQATAKRLLTTYWRAIAIPISKVAALQERIRRERAKLSALTIDESPPSAHIGEAIPQTRLIVDVSAMTATLDGECQDVRSKQALRWLAVLVAHPNEWISGADLAQYDSELMGARTHPLKIFLPDRIRDLIESDTGKGSRIRL